MARRSRRRAKRSAHYGEGVKEVKQIVRAGSERRRGGRTGGRAGGRRDDDEDGRSRERAPRPSSSPAPFIAMGAVVLVGLIVIALVASSGSSGRSSRGGGSPSASGGAAGAPAAASSSGQGAYSAPGQRRRPRLASAPVSFGFTGRGFDRAGNDNRELTAKCGSCDGPIASRIDRCPRADCNAKLRWPKTIRCKFCCPESELKFEDVDKVANKRGFCAHCCGSGKKAASGGGPDYISFGISRSGGGGGARRDKCKACKGSGACRWCKGNGWITVADHFN